MTHDDKNTCSKCGYWSRRPHEGSAARLCLNSDLKASSIDDAGNEIIGGLVTYPEFGCNQFKPVYAEADLVPVSGVWRNSDGSVVIDWDRCTMGIKTDQ